ncbi:hypothetical protein AB3S75_002751 [Citrus x aurantiifolia]
MSSGDVVALKLVHVNKLKKHFKSCFDCELNFLSSVNHPNIIRLYDSFQGLDADLDGEWYCENYQVWKCPSKEYAKFSS